MTSILLRRNKVMCSAVLALMAAVGGTATAQTLLPAVNFRTIPSMTGEQWPADFNGDGITDLVGRNKDSGVIQVVLGNGDGTFRAPIASTTTGWAIGVGDLNGDGAIDAVAQVGSNVAVLPGNRTGALGSPRTILAATATFASVAHMNNDTFRDVVIGEEGNSLHVVAGNGDLTFQPPVTLTTLDWPHGGLVADFNADGRRDVVVAHRYLRGLILFRNDGGLLFTRIDIPIDRSSTDVTARDLDGDTRLDLIVSARGPGDDGPWETGFVYVYKGNGNGTFGPPAVFETARGTHSVVVGDFTHDGRQDIATANHSYAYMDIPCGANNWGVDSLSILPGNGGLSFGSATTFAIFPQTYDPYAFLNMGAVGSLNTSDVNRDGFPDLLPGFGKVLLSVAPRANRPPTVSAGPDQTRTGDLDINVHGGGSDPDGHLLQFTWSDNGAGGDFSGLADDAPADACYFADTYGTYTLTLTADDHHGGTGSDSAVATFVRTPEPPSVVVLSPVDGEVLTAGVPYTIRWEASDFDGLREIDVYYSVDDLRTQNPITECTNLPGTTMQCTWQSPGPPVEGLGRILITATDNTGLEGSNSGGRFSIRPSSGSLPSGWTAADVGAVGAAGSSSHAGGVFTVRGSGADIWGSADEFHWAYVSHTGNFDVTVRVATVQNVNQWTKAGLMIRAGTAANAMHASLFATPTTVKGVAYQRRRTQGGTSVGTTGPLTAPPVWLRLSRRGSTIVASYRKAITDSWTRIGADTVSFGSTVQVGLAVSSHVDGTLATATFDNFTINSAPALTYRDIGAVGVAGRMTTDVVRTTIEASGADIWGTVDSFGYLYTPWSGDGTITARVRSLENTSASAKAGVMFRESLAANSKYVHTIVSPGRGLWTQYRSTTGGTAATAATRAGTAPEWVRLTRTGNTFVGATSNDGVTWTTLGTITVSMASQIYVGLPVTSRNNTTLATAVFDDVSFRR